MTESTPRRDFLFGRTLTGREGGASDRDPREAAGAGSPGNNPSNEPYVVRLSRKAMAGEFEICLPLAIAGEATAAALEALNLVQSLEGQLSFFKPQSDISTINRHAADAAVEVEPRLFALLQAAMQLWRDSGGAYDLTATSLWEAWGFARRAGTIPSTEELARAHSLVGGQWVELDETQKTIRLLRRGVRLNLGSIGKGYAVDRAAEHLAAAGVSDFLVHGGYSSVAARGSAANVGQPFQADIPTPDNKCQARAPCTHGRPDVHLQSTEAASDTAAVAPTARLPWKIGVKDPLRDELRLGQIELRDRALGTSGAQFQGFRHQGRRYGHILDPRTAGRPTASFPSRSWHPRPQRPTPFPPLSTSWARRPHWAIAGGTPQSPRSFLSRRATAGNCITMVWPRNRPICWRL